MSDVSSLLPPAPPVPATPRTLISSQANKDGDDDESVDSGDDSDVGSLYSCIPAPPPPLLKKPDNNSFPYNLKEEEEKEEEAGSQVMEDAQSHPIMDEEHGSGRGSERGSEFDLYNGVDGYVHLDQVDRAIAGFNGPVPPPAFNVTTAPQIFDISALGLANQDDAEVHSNTGYENLNIICLQRTKPGTPPWAPVFFRGFRVMYFTILRTWR